MKYLDFTSLFNGDPARIALFSTFQFDPNHFEKRLLRSSALSKARRIAIFLDARQWFEMLRQDVPARWLNRRYLVVPVYRPNGVFHPKLNLLLSEKAGQVQCGSNNLTRSGCSSNLELLNTVSFEMDGEHQEEMSLARDAFQFFRRAVEDADEEIARIGREWLEETAATFPWLNEPNDPDQERQLELIHTYDGGIWQRVVDKLHESPPTSLFVLSPFHDADCGLLRRVRQQWPRCRLEFLVQQGYTNLPVAPLKRFRSSVSLFELGKTTRRLHAKLLAWESAGGTGCLVGSANFTTAAFDGRNVECCLLLSEMDGQLKALFDRELPKRAIALDDFEPGIEEEPEAQAEELPCLRISSAVMVGDDQLRVSYSHRLDEKPQSLRLAVRTSAESRPVRTSAESRPRWSIKLPNMNSGTETVSLPENVLADAHGTILASLVAELEERREESIPVWIVQEQRLTYEPGEGSSSSKSKVEETGEGLPEYLDELGKREGVSAVVDYLRHLNIRFQDGASLGGGGRRFRLRIRDPFHADIAPDWLINAKAQSNDLEEAIYDFLDRHDKRRLRKHASRGNINGMENFVDILTAMIRLLYVYYRRGVVKRGKLIGRFCDYIDIATSGIEREKDPCDGFLYSVSDNLGGDCELLQEVCDETNFPGELRAILLIVQKVRYIPGEQSTYGPAPQRPKECLQAWSKRIRATLEEVGVEEPSKNDVRKALEDYRMFSTAEIDELLKEL